MPYIDELADMIKECDNIAFFGSAGVSTKSSVKDYRRMVGMYNAGKDYLLFCLAYTKALSLEILQYETDGISNRFCCGR